jgi:hypothetical protein
MYFFIRDSSVGIATRYGLDGRDSVPGRGRRSFSTPQRPDPLWGPPSLLSNGHRRLFPRRKSGRGVKLTTRLHLVSRSRMTELYLHSPTRLHGMVLNLLSTETTFSLCVSWCQDSLFGIVTGYWTAGFRFPAGDEIFLFSTASRPPLGSTQPPIQWARGALSTGVIYSCGAPIIIIGKTALVEP